MSSGASPFDVSVLDVSTLVESGGPWALLGLVVAETAFVTGLVVPASVATAFAAFLAADGRLPLSDVATFAATGALLGDSVGYWLGRRHGEGLLRGDGRIRALARRHEARVRGLFGSHPIYAVSFARLVSFVRTLMPMAAGMSRLAYHRFLFYDVLGVAGWLIAYCSAGYLAGRSWRLVAGAMGTGWALAFALVGLAWWVVARHRRLKQGEPSAVERRVARESAARSGPVEGEDPC